MTEKEEQKKIEENMYLIRFVCGAFAKNDLLEYDDIKQEAAIGLIKAVRSFDPQKHIKFNTYATQCMRRSILEIIRKKTAKKRKGTCCFCDYSWDSVETSREEKSDFDMIENKILAEQIIKYVEKRMSPDDAQIILMIQQGLTQTEIAKKMGMSQGNVAAKIKRIKKTVQRLLADK